MIDLYTFGTGNGRRASVLLEECGLPYTVHKVDLTKGEHKRPEYLRINPAGVIPAIVDAEGPGGKPLTLTQSGAIAIYAAEKTGRFLPKDPVQRMLTIQWLMHAVSDCALTVGTIFVSGMLPEKPVPVIELFKNRLTGFFKAIDGHLARNQYLASELSIADFALYTAVASGKGILQWNDMPNLDRWAAALAARPGVAKGMKVPT